MRVLFLRRGQLLPPAVLAYPSIYTYDRSICSIAPAGLLLGRHQWHHDAQSTSDTRADGRAAQPTCSTPPLPPPLLIIGAR